MKPNKVGCRVSGDVCIIHDSPLLCKHGCEETALHDCKEWDWNFEEWKKDQQRKDEEDTVREFFEPAVAELNKGEKHGSDAISDFEPFDHEENEFDRDFGQMD